MENTKKRTLKNHEIQITKNKIMNKFESDMVKFVCEIEGKKSQLVEKHMEIISNSNLPEDEKYKIKGQVKAVIQKLGLENSKQEHQLI